MKRSYKRNAEQTIRWASPPLHLYYNVSTAYHLLNDNDNQVHKI